MEDNGVDEEARESSPDARSFQSHSIAKADAESGSELPRHVLYERYGDYYDMSKDKHMIILNQHEFKSTVYFNYQKYCSRNGTFKDVESLETTFGKLGFKVVPYHDLDYDDIMDTVSKLCKADHQNTSCVAIAILTHGERGGELCAADRPYPVNDITTMLQRAPGLAGIPKLLFVQACRGQKVDEGALIQLDGFEAPFVIPTHADCLVLYSSFEEHLSYRDVNGSWLIQALCSVVSEMHATLDLLSMMTLVLRNVALRFTNTPSNRAMHNKKQMPEARFTLTKFLKFP